MISSFRIVHFRVRSEKSFARNLPFAKQLSYPLAGQDATVLEEEDVREDGNRGLDWAGLPLVATILQSLGCSAGN